MSERNLYAVGDRRNTQLVLVVTTKAERALDLIQAHGPPAWRAWTMANTYTRCIQRKVFEEEGVLTSVVLSGRLPERITRGNAVETTDVQTPVFDRGFFSVADSKL